MRTLHVLSIIFLATCSRVGAKSVSQPQPEGVIAAIFNDANANDESQLNKTGTWENVELTGFITKNGDILDVSGYVGTIESRQEPGPAIDAQPEPGMTMCRFDNIVVYSDTDCNRFFQSPLSSPVKNENTEDEEQQQDEIEEPPKKKVKKSKKSKKKGSKRKSNKNTRRRNTDNKSKRNKKQKGQIRRKALKQQGSKKRRQSNLNQNPKRRRNQQNNDNKTNQRRNRNKNTKRKQVDSDKERSISEPMQFAVLYDRP